MGLQLRGYQKTAISSWFKENGNGIFALATGTGKTLTSIVLINKLLDVVFAPDTRPLFVIIVVPFINLAKQWNVELEKFGVVATLCIGSRQTWMKSASKLVTANRLGVGTIGVLITTIKTLTGPAFQGLVADFPADMLTIVDEVHNVGTEKAISALPARSRYRLGLSATPKRWLDDDGTELISNYFGDVVAEKSIDEAISENILCPYDYYPVVVQLTDSEQELYIELSEKIARLSGGGLSELWGREDDSSPLNILLFKRSRLIGAASNKIPAILKIAESHRREDGLIIYCSDASSNESSIEQKQIDSIIKKISREPYSMTAARYTYETPPSVREELEVEFSKGGIQALVAIRCLDEGVDIPSMKTAIIAASTSNPRQFIQRRGRVLRKAPGKSHATIYDLVVTPGDRSELPDAVFNIERRMFRKELVRVTEFARDARNSSEAMHSLLDLRVNFNSMDI